MARASLIDAMSSGTHIMMRSIVSRLNREVTAVLRAAEIKDALVAQGIEPGPSTPTAFATHIRNEIAKWRTVVIAAGVQAE